MPGEFYIENKAERLSLQSIEDAIAALEVKLDTVKSQTDKTTAVFCHEIDGFRGYFLSRYGQISFVLSVLVIHEDYHLAAP